MDMQEIVVNRTTRKAWRITSTGHALPILYTHALFLIQIGAAYEVQEA